MDTRCELVRTLNEMNEEGFQAVDFEKYREGGQETWAVLLEKRPELDWLTFPATAAELDQRNERLASRSASLPDPGDAGGSPGDDTLAFRLQDLDLLYVLTVEGQTTHLGTIHDGGTSGPDG